MNTLVDYLADAMLLFTSSMCILTGLYFNKTSPRGTKGMWLSLGFLTFGLAAGIVSVFSILY